MMRIDSLDCNITSSGNHSQHKTTGFKPVGYGIKNSAMQLFRLDSVDDELVAARTAYFAAHGINKVCQVDNFRILGSVIDNGLPFGQHGSQHDVFSSAVRGRIKNIFGP